MLSGQSTAPMTVCSAPFLDDFQAIFQIILNRFGACRDNSGIFQCSKGRHTHTLCVWRPLLYKLQNFYEKPLRGAPDILFTAMPLAGYGARRTSRFPARVRAGRGFLHCRKRPPLRLKMREKTRERCSCPRRCPKQCQAQSCHRQAPCRHAVRRRPRGVVRPFVAA